MTGAGDVSVILAVDDDPDARALLDRALGGAGFAVVFAQDGRSALSLLGEMTPDLILLDAVMPPPDGFETCRRIKAEPRLAPIPVIFMTGLSDSGHVIEGLNAGGVDLSPSRSCSTSWSHAFMSTSPTGARCAAPRRRST